MTHPPVMPANPLLILDADGVFMDESPYWNTALVVFARRVGLDCLDVSQWETLSRACMFEQRIQRVTKVRGCNSNWDMTAIMVRAIKRAELRDALQVDLNEGNHLEFFVRLRDEMASLWTGGESSDPLAGFGIERNGGFFKDIVAEFQSVFDHPASVDWAYPRQVPVLPPDRLRSIFSTLTQAGYLLGVCTSRTESETIGPMKDFGFLDFFDQSHIATHDQAIKAEEVLDVAPLGKPHPFQLLCAVFGFEEAVKVFGDGVKEKVREHSRRVIYVGDTSSDFGAAKRCCDIGLAVSYIHVDSGLTPTSLRLAIEAWDSTLLVASGIAECAEFLVRSASEVGS